MSYEVSSQVQKCGTQAGRFGITNHAMYLLVAVCSFASELPNVVYKLLNILWGMRHASKFERVKLKYEHS